MHFSRSQVEQALKRGDAGMTKAMTPRETSTTTKDVERVNRRLTYDGFVLLSLFFSLLTFLPERDLRGEGGSQQNQDKNALLVRLKEIRSLREKLTSQLHELETEQDLIVKLLTM